ncbi:NAD(P)H-dependent oxidoreductase [Sulfurimicrobium lacus]|uniref:NAD(P)H-dependent oxidoreductase n=1 Tax=Sulfurimicrobium lacus TaxID=2715678 RepID=A0A6F8VIA2_9PROT|nr:NAD(P)H-dependent oxidoreductase [Sulfurimicrobium lacus]BCB28495.1 NAD(P)H-dependent oxidoreductase [Sulfurimicrobium lacus]
MSTQQDILSAFQFRHACKQFDAEKKIPAEDFDFILETGRLSPCSFGFEPWHFVVIQTPELRAKLREVTWGAQGTLPSSSHFMVILCRKDDMRFDSAYIDNFMRTVQKLPADVVEKKRAKYQKFQESDFRLLESPRALFDWSCKQAYIALGNMMSAAAMIGIDSCPIEGYDFRDAEAVLTAAGVLDQDKYGLAVMVAFGYRVNPQPAKTRQTMAEVVTWVK